MWRKDSDNVLCAQFGYISRNHHGIHANGMRVPVVFRSYSRRHLSKQDVCTEGLCGVLD